MKTKKTKPTPTARRHFRRRAITRKPMKQSGHTTPEKTKEIKFIDGPAKGLVVGCVPQGIDRMEFPVISKDLGRFPSPPFQTVTYATTDGTSFYQQ